MPQSRDRDRITLGFIGCGRATATLHLPALEPIPEIDVVAVCDTDPARAESVARRFGIASSYTDPGAFLNHPSLDAVAVCTPPERHADVAEAVLAAGKHLFLEKPLALTLADCNRVISAAASVPVRTVMGLNLRQHRLLRSAREVIRDGTLGPVQLLRSSFTTDIRLRSDLAPWRNQRRSGGGVLFELAVHHFDLWRWLLDHEVEEVHAWTEGGDAEDQTAAVTARLNGRLLATAQLSERTHPGNEIEVLGEKGRLQISLYDFDGLSFTPVSDPPGGIGSRLRRLRRTAINLPAGVSAARRGGEYLATFGAEWRQFAATVIDGAPSAASLEDGRAATSISIAAARSAVRGRPVRLDELDSSAEAE